MIERDTMISWNEANQRYLMATIRVVKAQLKAGISNQSDNLAGNQAAQLIVEEVQQRMEEAARDLSSPSSLDILVKVFGLSNFEKTILLMCAGVELDSQFADLIAGLQEGSALPTFSLALSSMADAHWSALSPDAPLRYWRLIELTHGQLMSKAPIKIDEHILHFLAGIQQLDERLSGIVNPFLSVESDLVCSHLKLANLIVNDVSAQNRDGILPVLELSGNNKADKETITGYLSRQFGIYPYSISIHHIPSGNKDVIELARIWSRESALKLKMLFIDYTEVDITDKSRVQSIISFIDNIQSLVIVGTDKNMPALTRSKKTYPVTKPTPNEQLALWQQHFVGTDQHFGETDFEKLVAQFNLSATTIHAVAASLQKNNTNGSVNNAAKSSFKTLWKSCCHHARPDVGELAQRIEPAATMDELVLPEIQKEILRDLIMQVRQRTKVYNDWGFASRSLRGLGITALFTGESGTGKTMAAEVLANELQLELYRIDLSQVINKYIGETEKNLKKIFDAAEDGGAILLFDEADALFGKRSEVKDSHDRYANMEVSYLLQRMEAYRGLAILTTNMKNTLDKAWMRRLRFIIHFPFPDIVQRAEIWRRIFPLDTPTENLEIDKLARLSLAGGNIRNIALNASFIAANEGTPVRMSQVSRAVRSEYTKLEKPLTNTETGNW